MEVAHDPQLSCELRVVGVHRKGGCRVPTLEVGPRRVVRGNAGVQVPEHRFPVRQLLEPTTFHVQLVAEEEADEGTHLADKIVPGTPTQPDGGRPGVRADFATDRGPIEGVVQRLVTHVEGEPSGGRDFGSFLLQQITVHSVWDRWQERHATSLWLADLMVLGQKGPNGGVTR